MIRWPCLFAGVCPGPGQRGRSDHRAPSGLCIDGTPVPPRVPCWVSLGGSLPSQFLSTHPAAGQGLRAGGDEPGRVECWWVGCPPSLILGGSWYAGGNVHRRLGWKQARRAIKPAMGGGQGRLRQDGPRLMLCSLHGLVVESPGGGSGVAWSLLCFWGVAGAEP